MRGNLASALAAQRSQVMNDTAARAQDWLDIELDDLLDENLELELELGETEELRAADTQARGPALNRRDYFHHLIKLQSELIKLQTWVGHTGAKLVVLFEGRDSAGKGGAIKRITQRLNPRLCRVVALPAPTASEEQVEQFFRDVPEFERMLVRSGIVLVKYWFSITDHEQQMRFLMRIKDP